MEAVLTDDENNDGESRQQATTLVIAKGSSESKTNEERHGENANGDESGDGDEAAEDEEEEVAVTVSSQTSFDVCAVVLQAITLSRIKTHYRDTLREQRHQQPRRSSSSGWSGVPEAVPPELLLGPFLLMALRSFQLQIRRSCCVRDKDHNVFMRGCCLMFLKPFRPHILEFIYFFSPLGSHSNKINYEWDF